MKMKKIICLICISLVVILFFVGLDALFDYVMYKLTNGNKHLMFAYALFITPVLLISIIVVNGMVDDSIDRLDRDK